MLTKFKHPVTAEDVFFILDACHMLKLARNTLAFLGTFSSSDNNRIQWKFFHALNLVQTVSSSSMHSAGCFLEILSQHL
jgi:hypothetical protein